MDLKTEIKNHYKVLDVPRSSSSKDIKAKTKILLKNIKNSDISVDEKKKLVKKVYESYNFLTDYHLRKSLDEYLDKEYEKNYKIIDEKDYMKNNNLPNSPFDLLLNNNFPKVSLFEIPLNDIFDNDFEKHFKSNDNNKSKFYSSSSLTTTKLDKYGNVVSKTKQYINDNGKKDTKEFTKTIDKNKLNKAQIKPITFIL